MLNKLAERKGFEPSIRFWRIHTFQACAFDHSATSLMLNHKVQGAQISEKNNGGQVLKFINPQLLERHPSTRCKTLGRYIVISPAKETAN